MRQSIPLLFDRRLTPPMSCAGHRTKTWMPARHRVGSIGWCTPGMGMNLWGGSPLSEDLTSTMLTILKTSRRQGQHREVLSEGSRSAKRRADGQESDTRLSRRVEWAPDHEDQESARYGKSGGCVATVHVLIRGDLSHVRRVLLRESNCGPVRKDWNNHRTLRGYAQRAQR